MASPAPPPPRSPSISSGNSETSDDDQEFGDWISESGNPPTKSLFDDTILPNASDALRHDKEVHNFDLVQFSADLGLDVHQRIRLVNYIRKNKPLSTTLIAFNGKEALFTDDSYLKPTIEDDPLLQLQTDDWTDSEDEETDLAITREKKQKRTAEQEIARLKEKLANAQSELAEMRRLIQGKAALLGISSEDYDTAPAPSAPRDDDTHYFQSYSGNEIHWTMLSDHVRTSTYASFILSNPALFKGKVVMDVGCGTGILSMFAAKAGARKVFAIEASGVADKAEEIIKSNGYSDVITLIRGKVELIKLPEFASTKIDIIVSEWMGYGLLYEAMLDSVLHARDRFLQPDTGVMVPSQCRMVLSMCDPEYIIKKRVEFWKDVYGYDMRCMTGDVFEEGIVDHISSDAVLTTSAIVKDLNIQNITTKGLSFSSEFQLKPRELPLSPSAKKTSSYFSTKVHENKIYAKAFILWFDTFFDPKGQMVPPEYPVKLHTGEAEVGDVLKLRPLKKRRTTGELRGGLKRQSSQGTATSPTSPTFTTALDTASAVTDEPQGSEEPAEEIRVESFSTGPFSQETHWKQVVFLLKEPILLDTDVSISGTFHCRKSDDNSRELDVEFQYKVHRGGKEGGLVVQSFKIC